MCLTLAVHVIYWQYMSYNVLYYQYVSYIVSKCLIVAVCVLYLQYVPYIGSISLSMASLPTFVGVLGQEVQTD